MSRQKQSPVFGLVAACLFSACGVVRNPAPQQEESVGARDAASEAAEPATGTDAAVLLDAGTGVPSDAPGDLPDLAGQAPDLAVLPDLAAARAEVGVSPGPDAPFGAPEAGFIDAPVPVLVLGEACRRKEECASGECVDGVCCDRACAGSCHSCALPATRGRCTALPAGAPPPEGRPACLRQGPETCGGTGLCDGTGGCQLYPYGTTCRAASCVEGRATPPGICDGGGACSGGVPAPCQPYKCDSYGEACARMCVGDGDCVGTPCFANRCRKLPKGARCERAEDCEDGHCSLEGVCCNRDCAAPCEACDLPGREGTCSPVTSGQPRGRKSSCAGSGVCGGQCAAGSTECTFPTAACGPISCDLDLLFGAPTCVAGVCNPAAPIRSCWPYRCSAAAGGCRETCSSPDDCMPGTLCTSSGKCVADLRDVALGAEHTCALASQQAFCWGDNQWRQLGANITDLEHPRPVAVTTVDDGLAIVAGHSHTCALTAGDVVTCWGTNAFGELGNGTSGAPQEPVLVRTESGDLFFGATSLCAGEFLTCAIAGGSVYCWGQNQWGQLARPATGLKPHPNPVLIPGVSNAVWIGCGRLSVFAREAGGAVKAWGANEWKKLADGAEERITTPVTLNLPEIVELAATAHSACARLPSGDFSCWGSDMEGGFATMNDDMTMSAPGIRTNGAGLTQLTGGLHHACALFGDSLRCWGHNSHGQGGDGTGSMVNPTPAPVVDLGMRAVKIGGGPLALHTCAILEDKSLRCWGRNWYGQVGVDTKRERVLRPVSPNW